jgi:hypothetical protein
MLSKGWCPPIPILRQLGIRTASEIDTERYSLKVIRGDFDNLPKNNAELGQRDIGTRREGRQPIAELPFLRVRSPGLAPADS